MAQNPPQQDDELEDYAWSKRDKLWKSFQKFCTGIKEDFQVEIGRTKNKITSVWIRFIKRF